MAHELHPGRYRQTYSFLVHNMKTYRGRRGTAPLILRLDSRMRPVVNSYVPGALPRGKNPGMSQKSRPYLFEDNDNTPS
jgi:hypothetical protein